MEWEDEKTQPDPRRLSPHEVGQSMRAADSGDVDDVFANPEDGLDRADAPAIDAGVETHAPDLADELDHAGMDAGADPENHPGGAVEEQLKGLPSRWGKASP